MAWSIHVQAGTPYGAGNLDRVRSQQNGTRPLSPCTYLPLLAVPTPCGVSEIMLKLAFTSRHPELVLVVCEAHGTQGIKSAQACYAYTSPRELNRDQGTNLSKDAIVFVRASRLQWSLASVPEQPVRTWPLGKNRTTFVEPAASRSASTLAYYTTKVVIRPLPHDRELELIQQRHPNEASKGLAMRSWAPPTPTSNNVESTSSDVWITVISSHGLLARAYSTEHESGWAQAAYLGGCIRLTSLLLSGNQNAKFLVGGLDNSSRSAETGRPQQCVALGWF